MGTTDVWFAVNLINALLAIEDIELPGRDAPDARRHRERRCRAVGMLEFAIPFVEESFETLLYADDSAATILFRTCRRERQQITLTTILLHFHCSRTGSQ